jgi:hypothetical protein
MNRPIRIPAGYGRALLAFFVFCTLSAGLTLACQQTPSAGGGPVKVGALSGGPPVGPQPPGIFGGGSLDASADGAVAVVTTGGFGQLKTVAVQVTAAGDGSAWGTGSIQFQASLDGVNWFNVYCTPATQAPATVATPVNSIASGSTGIWICPTNGFYQFQAAAINVQDGAVALTLNVLADAVPIGFSVDGSTGGMFRTSF